MRRSIIVDGLDEHVTCHTVWFLSASGGTLPPNDKYNYFRFETMNGRHIGILLPVSILTGWSSSAFLVASAHQIPCESDRRRPSYDVMSIFKMADVSHIVFPVR